MDESKINSLIADLDAFASSDTSRMKVEFSDDMTDGQSRKEYHHGRCDVNSPWARGCAFDVLE